jgi:hypothetical protein
LRRHDHGWSDCVPNILILGVATLSKKEELHRKARVASDCRNGSRSMSLHSPTHIIVFLKPENEEHALYLIGESFPSTAYTIVDTQEEQVTWGTVFVLIHKEKRLTVALAAPVTPKQIEEIAYLVKIGLILGFVVRGEIDLGERVINNLE